MQLALQVAVAARRCGVHVQNTLPHLVKMVLAEAATTLEHRLELRRLGISHKGRHDIKATGRPGHPVRIAHGSPMCHRGARR